MLLLIMVHLFIDRKHASSFELTEYKALAMTLTISKLEQSSLSRLFGFMAAMAGLSWWY